MLSTCSEFNTGKERLVKVLKQHRLREVFDLLGMWSKHAHELSVTLSNGSAAARHKCPYLLYTQRDIRVAVCYV